MATATKSPTVVVSIATFDGGHNEPIFRVIRDGISIGAWQPMTRRNYNPRGNTPLRDAMARFIAHLDTLRAPGTVVIGCLADESGSMGGTEESVVSGINEFVAGMADVEPDPEAAGQVLAVILTDGLENASREVSAEQLRDMLEAREADDNWTFLYLGTNQDAWAAGENYGFTGETSKASTYNYTPGAGGTRSAMAAATTDASLFLAANKVHKETKEGLSSKGHVAEDGTVLTAGGVLDVAAALAKAKEQTKR